MHIVRIDIVATQNILTFQGVRSHLNTHTPVIASKGDVWLCVIICAITISNEEKTDKMIVQRRKHWYVRCKAQGARRQACGCLDNDWNDENGWFPSTERSPDFWNSCSENAKRKKEEGTGNDGEDCSTRWNIQTDRSIKWMSYLLPPHSSISMWGYELIKCDPLEQLSLYIEL